jgi:hypothetical protein
LSKLQGTTPEHRYYSGVFSYVDENGEARISAPAATHKVVSLRQAEAYKAELEAEKWRSGSQGDFTFAAMRELHEVYETLTTAQCGYLLLLQCYVNYDDGTLVNADKAKTPMKTSDMMKALQLERKRSTFYNFLNACVDNGIIIEKDDGTYAVNQRYHFRGVTDNPFVIKSYTAKVKRVYKEVKAADLGLIYRMLPLVHYETNALCANPFETVPEQIRFLNRKELAEAIGVDPQTISKRLPKITFDGEYVIARVRIGDVERYMFNPWVFYRKSTAPDKTLRALFSAKPAKRKR